ncbi:hypothetical protein ANN_08799 [Periplaneta americana]|uniref:RING-CH-type domain-containing protein n=1 Tax=Periplaneta americana TaxID=6978 RepID=A0ABQ8T2H3_PERAM|nr:hypothetical protein ANN_08799 [Periplaneta americana]
MSQTFVTVFMARLGNLREASDFSFLVPYPDIKEATHPCPETNRTLLQAMQPFPLVAQTQQEHESGRASTATKKHLQRDASKDIKVLEDIADVPEEYCRICFDSESHESLISPCCCRGTLAKIHLSCLERWLEESNSSMCELCTFQYTTERCPRYGVTRSLALWLASGTSPHLMLDIASLCILTPLAVIGTDFVIRIFAQRPYVAIPEWIVVGDVFHQSDIQQPESILNKICRHLITVGAITFIGVIDLVHVTWIYTQVKYHAMNWYEWWRRHSKGRWCDILVINAHAPTEEKDDDIKDSFYEELEHTFDQLPRYHMKVLLGDFNAKVGEEIFLDQLLEKRACTYVVMTMEFG